MTVNRLGVTRGFKVTRLDGEYCTGLIPVFSGIGVSWGKLQVIGCFDF